MKKLAVGLIIAVSLVTAVSATNWENDEEWENFSEIEFEWDDDWMDDPFFHEEPKFPEIDTEEPEEPEKPVFDEEKEKDSRNTDEFETTSATLSFQDQNLSNESVTVENVTMNQNSTLIITYEEDGELVIAGLETVERASEEVEVLIENAEGFPGEHTAHIIATEDLSSNYTIGDNVSEQTAEEILDSETADVTEQATEQEPSGQLDFSNQNLSENTAVTVENVTTEQESTLILTYSNNTTPTIAGITSADDLEDQEVEIRVENDNGFPGNHTAHIVPDEGLSSEYEVSDNVSEETDSNILESETALVE